MLSGANGDLTAAEVLHGVELAKGKSLEISRNLSPAVLYEEAIKYDEGVAITSTGALSMESGKRKGRSPSDKRLVDHAGATKDFWWGPVNIKLDSETFTINLSRALDYLATLKRVYVFDGFAGWNEKYKQKIRVVCTRPYHALFMHNMLIRPTEKELETYGEPDFTIYNAGSFPANVHTKGMTSATSVCVDMLGGKMVILGTGYAGEMKKGVFTYMHYKMPMMGALSLHASANEGKCGDVALFFGLSGTGKTTLSADPNRSLIGDDEHVWCDEGVFNIEAGCYAKCIGLKEENEPEIFSAIKFGSVLENVGLDPKSRIVDYDDASKTENTRCSYPIEYIPNSKIPCMSGHPKNIILLTCDAFGVLPPVSKLTPEQAMYHFISGYTAKIPGTEVGVQEPVATFSACFGAPFLVFHPAKYANMLAEKIKSHSAHVWLVNTGWTGGKYKVGSRIPLKYSRAIMDAITSGELESADYEAYSGFNLSIPKSVTGVPQAILNPQKAWIGSEESYNQTISSLVDMFKKNFKLYESSASDATIAAGPK